MKRLLFLGTFLSVFLFYHPRTFGQFKLPNNTLNLDSIKVSEIFDEGSNQAGDARVETTLITPALGTPSLNTTVTRSVTNLWQIEIPDTQDVSQLSVIYSVESDKGSSGKLSNQNNSDEIKVTVKASDPPIQKIADNIVKKTRTLQGGATFSLDLSDVKTSGSYSGTLRVDITGI